MLSRSEQETKQFGERLSKCLKPGDIICLNGELGSGKTTLVKGIAKGLEVKEGKVNSPTFVLMNIYNGKMPIYHFDLYRINDNEQMAPLGFSEFFYGEGISVIEWAERLSGFAPKDCLKIQLKHKKENERDLKVSAIGRRSKEIVKKLDLR